MTARSDTIEAARLPRWRKIRPFNTAGERESLTDELTLSVSARASRQRQLMPGR
jgi:hypothetical protein